MSAGARRSFALPLKRPTGLPMIRLMMKAPGVSASLSRRVTAVWVPAALTSIAFVILYSYHLVGDLPLWVLLVVLGLSALAGEVTGRGFDPSMSARKLQLAMGVQVIGVTAVIYAIGWGATLAIGYVFVLERALEEVGSRVWRPTLVWTVVSIMGGQVAVGLGVVPTYVPSPYVHGLAALVLLGMAFVLRLVGSKTEQQELGHAQLEAGEDSFRRLFANNPQPMWVYDADTLALLEVNEAAIAHYGYTRDEFLALGITDIRPEEDVPRLLASLDSRVDSLETTRGWRHRLKDGRIIDVEVSSHQLVFDDRPAVLVAVQDVTERNAVEDELRHQASHDALTGAATRGTLLAGVTQAVSSDEMRGVRVGVVVFDIDQFKLVNDSLGAEAADTLLRLVVQRLQHRLGADELLARLGADQFAVMLVSGGFEQVYRDAEALREALAQPFVVASQPLYISASAGLAVAREPVASAELLRRADDAMHRAKQRGRNRLEVFDREDDLAPGTRLALVRDLRSVLERGKLTVHYQPIVDLETHDIAGVEALARCENPISLPPSVFVPLAEEAGLIGVLGEQILAMSVGEAMQWPNLWLAVNVSPRQLLDPNLPDRILGLLRIAGMPPTRLVLEVTETVLLEDSTTTTRTLCRLADAGIALAIDDFGSGFAGLQYLQRFPLSEIKIDRSLIDHLDERPERLAVTRALIDMAASLGIDVVAEGVERDAERQLLVELGCKYAQGFLFAQPMPARELTAFLRDAGSGSATAPCFPVLHGGLVPAGSSPIAGSSRL